MKMKNTYRVWCVCVRVQLQFMGNVDVDRVSAIFRDALSSFMGRRKSPLTAQMFTDLFTRFPVSAAAGRESGSGHHGDQTSRLIQLWCLFFQVLCVNLLDAAVQHITSGVRVHQQVKILLLQEQTSQVINKQLKSRKVNKWSLQAENQLQENTPDRRYFEQTSDEHQSGSRVN